LGCIGPVDSLGSTQEGSPAKLTGPSRPKLVLDDMYNKEFKVAASLELLTCVSYIQTGKVVLFLRASNTVAWK